MLFCPKFERQSLLMCKHSESQFRFQELEIWQRGAAISGELFQLTDILEKRRLCHLLLAFRRRLKS